MDARQLCRTSAFASCFDLSCFFLIFSQPELRGISVYRHQTLLQCSTVIQIHKIRSEILGPSPKICGPKTSKFLRFRDFIRICLRNAIRYRQTENGVAKNNCDHSRTCIINLVNYGLQMVKNRTGVSTDPTGGHHAGLSISSLL